jgi:hypothetical protein
VRALRAAGHDVYDFRNPGEGETGFSWAHVDAAWQDWSVSQFRDGLAGAPAAHAFGRDQRALEWCDLCVLVLPSGMSAHLEAGWCSGRSKRVLIYAPEIREAELMYKLFDIHGETPIFETLELVLEHVAKGPI